LASLGLLLLLLRGLMLLLVVVGASRAGKHWKLGVNLFKINKKLN
jgi:hypothetical protein